MAFALPRLYPILDRAFLPDGPAGARLDALAAVVSGWLQAGAALLQYRNKRVLLHPREALMDAREILRLASAAKTRPLLIMNDRADLALAASFDGVHIGQDDLSPAAIRKIIGPQRWYGVSCHNEAQLAAAEATDADYLAIGPVFCTQSKADPDPELGLARLAAMRRLTAKPLVAIGGITLENCRSVIGAGADSVAVISALFPAGAAPSRDVAAKSVADFLRILR